MIFNHIFKYLLWPFSFLPPLWALVGISFFTSLLILLVFKYTSAQEAIQREKDQIKGHLLEILLYRNDPMASFRSQVRVLKHNLLYIRHILFPLVITIIPVIIILSQIDVRYGKSPYQPGDRFIVDVTIKGPFSDQDSELSLMGSDGLKVETPSLRIPSQKKVSWRVRVLNSGIHSLFLSHPEEPEPFIKEVNASENLYRFTKKMKAWGFSSALLNPGFEKLPGNSRVSSINIEYPAARHSILGLRVHWLIIFFILTIVWGVALKAIIKVNI